MHVSLCVVNLKSFRNKRMGMKTFLSNSSFDKIIDRLTNYSIKIIVSRCIVTVLYLDQLNSIQLNSILSCCATFNSGIFHRGSTFQSWHTLASKTTRMQYKIIHVQVTFWRLSPQGGSAPSKVTCVGSRERHGCAPPCRPPIKFTKFYWGRVALRFRTAEQWQGCAQRP